MEWASVTLTHWRKDTDGTCYFTSAFCGSVVFHQGSDWSFDVSICPNFVQMKTVSMGIESGTGNRMNQSARNGIKIDNGTETETDSRIRIRIKSVTGIENKKSTRIRIENEDKIGIDS
ncbi:hypothetical protein EVAR_95239_1 [Eumeta japonica]|uniref:Uncharacterized protein n=1 Tax=Eumeta variegata TaxID=151549 RepID=A0A4C1UJX5_EUMVA|nr:hypothetical protein EVAR_95239_1 [Eumeta japonica]